MKLWVSEDNDSVPMKTNAIYMACGLVVRALGRVTITSILLACFASTGAVGAICADRPTIDLSAGPVGQERQLDTIPRTATAWEWTLLQQPSGSTTVVSALNVRNPKFTPDLPGTYVFQLKATNSVGAFATRTLSFPAVGPVLIQGGTGGEPSKPFSFTLQGETGQVVVVETSTNLSQWTRLETNAIGSSPLALADSVAQNSACKFYRARSQFYAPFTNYLALGSPEGVAVDHLGNVYLGFMGLYQVWKIDPAGKRTVFASFTGAPPVGLAVDALGNLYVARAEGTGKGVDRIGPDRRAVHVPGTENMAMANSVTLDSEGNLYATESFSYVPPLVYYPGVSGSYGKGAVWRVPQDGQAQLWVRDDLLTGTGLWRVSGRPWGANGIGYYQGAVYVANTERGLVLRIPVLPGGGPGAIETFAQVPDPDPSQAAQFGLAGPDGLALDADGNVYVPVANRCAVVRIRPNQGGWDLLATTADNLSVPLSVCFGTTLGERTCLYVSSGTAPISGLPSPGLVKIETGSLGLPVR